MPQADLQDARAKRCKRYVKLKGKLTAKGNSRTNQFTLKRRFAGRKLAPGRYRLVVVARDTAGNTSAIKRIRFRIKR